MELRAISLDHLTDAGARAFLMADNLLTYRELASCVDLYQYGRSHLQTRLMLRVVGVDNCA
jgi:hypothetical protein